MAFIPETREEAVAQLLAVAKDYRKHYPPRPGSIGRSIARRAIRRAREMRAADDWRSVMWHPWPR